MTKLASIVEMVVLLPLRLMLFYLVCFVEITYLFVGSVWLDYSAVRLCDISWDVEEPYLCSAPTKINDSIEAVYGECGSYFLFSGLFSPSKKGVLLMCTDKGTEKIADGVISSVCTSSGVAYVDKDGLHDFDGENTELVSCNSSVYCWNGTALVYYTETDRTVYSYTAKGSEPLFVLGSGGYSYVLANECYTVLIRGNGFVCYNNASGTVAEFSWRAGTIDGEQFYLYQNYLVYLGEDAVYDLSTGERQDIVGLNGSGDRNYQSWGLAVNEKLYFTVKTMFHVYEDTVETATYVIDTETWKAEKINDEWYTMLCKDGDNITGVGNGRFSLKRKVIICGS